VTQRGGSNAVGFSFVGAMLLSIATSIALTPKAEILPRYIQIATASVAGIYHARGTDICAQINSGPGALRCIAAPSPGSLANLGFLTDPIRHVDAAIIQSDVFAEGKQDGAPVVALSAPGNTEGKPMPLHREALFIIVRAEDGVSQFSDLTGKRIALDKEGSGTRIFGSRILAGANMLLDTNTSAQTIPSRYADALCAGDIDAGFWVVSDRHRPPTSGVNAQGEPCELALLDLPSEVFEATFKPDERLLYDRVEIFMEGCSEPAQSYGPLAYIVTSEDTLASRPGDIGRIMEVGHALSMEARTDVCQTGKS